MLSTLLLTTTLFTIALAAPWGPVGTKYVKVYSRGSFGNVDMGRDLFNAYFQNQDCIPSGYGYGAVAIECPGCAFIPHMIYYKRLTKATTVDMYNLFINRWDPLINNHYQHRDFEFYENPWYLHGNRVWPNYECRYQPETTRYISFPGICTRGGRHCSNRNAKTLKAKSACLHLHKANFAIYLLYKKECVCPEGSMLSINPQNPKFNDIMYCGLEDNCHCPESRKTDNAEKCYKKCLLYGNRCVSFSYEPTPKICTLYNQVLPTAFHVKEQLFCRVITRNAAKSNDNNLLSMGQEFINDENENKNFSSFDNKLILIITLVIGFVVGFSVSCFGSYLLFMKAKFGTNNDKNVYNTVSIVDSEASDTGDEN